MLNNISVMGRITHTPELRTTNSGISVLSFSIANETGYGEKRKTTFFDCIAWKSSAEFIAKYFGKGDMIAITGVITDSKYTDKQGNERTKKEVTVNSVDFCGGRKSAENITTETPSEEDLPF